MFIIKTKQTPSFESLPVGKAIALKLEGSIYCPYVQFQGAILGENLIFRLCAFECVPSDTSKLVLAIKGENKIFTFSFKADKTADLSSNICDYKYIGGEDLQGVYWGVRLTVPLKALGLSDISHLKGNLFKQSTTQNPHLTALFDVGDDYKKADDFSIENIDETQLGEFIITEI